MVWAWGDQAPVGFSENSHGCSLLLGYALDHRDRKLNAGLLLKEWTDQISDRHAWDGYFASLRYSESVGLAVDVDPLGLFPMFVHQQNGAFIVGTSGALFEAHPRFQSQLDPVGLAGILLTNGLVNERTMLKDVRQLRAGCRLFRSPEGVVSEIRTREFDVSPCEQNRPYDQILASVKRGSTSKRSWSRPAVRQIRTTTQDHPVAPRRQRTSLRFGNHPGTSGETFPPNRPNREQPSFHSQRSIPGGCTDSTAWNTNLEDTSAGLSLRPKSKWSCSTQIMT